uniref:BAG domain-containing protein Samui n=1 Tax=Lygus hesperus TaxID=30085 RepID=A0A146MCF4_LYGHE
MSFPFRDRDRPSLRDRLRGFGKSGDEIMEQLKQSLDEDRKNFFESNSKFGRSPGGFSSSRGFPFDDDVMHGKSKLKDHLDDLVKRHPELADQLKDWGDIERSPKIPRGGLSSQPNTYKEQPQDQRNQPPNPGEGGGCSSPGPSKPQNLRNTVPDMQAQQEKMDHQRNQRSQSAPPEGPPVKGPVPQNENTAQPMPNNDVNSQQQNQNSGQPQQQQQTQGAQSQVRGNERYIPIFVEGRGETIVNVPVQKDGQPTQTPPPRQKKSFKAPPPPGAAATQQSPPPPPAPSPAPSAAPSQDAVPPPQQAPPQAAAPPPAQPPRPPSPLTQVATIQKEVDDLKQRVDAFKGSKTDKEYVYLDEMLTRNLLKLDNIDSEGREEVRMARKEVIKLIQQCINVLESCQNSNNP